MSQKTEAGQPIPQLINTRRAAEILGRPSQQDILHTHI